MDVLVAGLELPTNKGLLDETLRLCMICVYEILALYLLDEEDLLMDVVVHCKYAHLTSAYGYIIEPFIKALPSSLLLFLEIAKNVTHRTE